MNFGIKIMILFGLISTIVLSFISFEKSVAQSDDSDSNNLIDQDGDGNEASNGDEKSQDTNQNSMCVSGESVSLSCNNFSSESIGSAGQQGELGPENPTGLSYQLTLNIKSGERGWQPGDVSNTIDLTGLISGVNSGVLRDDISFQTNTWNSGEGQLAYQNCTINSLSSNPSNQETYLDIVRCESLSSSPLTIVTNSVNPLTP